MKRYVLGFMFDGFMLDSDLQRVALIVKQKPEWQAGLMNGIGGKIEDTDMSDLDAMVREFAEETGFIHPDWSEYCKLTDNESFEVYCFACVGPVELLKTQEEEIVRVVQVSSVTDRNSVENLPWLIRLAIDHLEDGRPKYPTAIYPISQPA